MYQSVHLYSELPVIHCEQITSDKHDKYCTQTWYSPSQVKNGDGEGRGALARGWEGGKGAYFKFWTIEGAFNRGRALIIISGYTI